MCDIDDVMMAHWGLMVSGEVGHFVTRAGGERYSFGGEAGEGEQSLIIWFV